MLGGRSARDVRCARMQVTRLMEKREEVSTEILKHEQHTLKIAAEAAFVVSNHYQHPL